MTPLQIFRPSWCVGVHFRTKFDVPTYSYASGVEKHDRPGRIVAVLHLSEKHPVVAAEFTRNRGKVFASDPAFSFVRVSSLGPLPERCKDRVVYLNEGSLGADVPVVHRPSLDFWVEQPYQVACCCRFVRLHDFAEVGEKTRDIRFGRRNQKLAAVLANVLTQEVEAFVYMRDGGLLLREFQSPFA